MRKLMLIGDSLSLPRFETVYEKTWVYYLKKSKDMQFDVIEKTLRGRTTSFLNEPDAIEDYMPNIIILWLGICDCAPRLLYRFEKRIVHFLPRPVREAYISMCKRIRGRNRYRNEVGRDQFKANVNEFILRSRRLNVERIIILKISEPGSRYLNGDPVGPQTVSDYNEILEFIGREYSDYVNVIEPFSGNHDIDALVIDDGYHPSELGHSLIWQSVWEEITRKRD